MILIVRCGDVATGLVVICRESVVTFMFVNAPLCGIIAVRVYLLLAASPQTHPKSVAPPPSVSHIHTYAHARTTFYLVCGVAFFITIVGQARGIRKSFLAVLGEYTTVLSIVTPAEM